MHFKGLKFCASVGVLALTAHTAMAAEAPTAWDYSPVGECTNNFKIPKPGPDYQMTVKVEKNTDAHKNRYVWIWDPTPERNPTRQLIRISPKKVGCTVLFMPYSDSHNFKLAPGGELPDTVVSTSSVVNEEHGGHYSEQEYVLNKSTGAYQKMPTCYVVQSESKKREKASCSTSMGD
jgi:hypothetical protein